MSAIVTKRGKRHLVGLYHAAQFMAAELSKRAPGALDRTVENDPDVQHFQVDVMPDTSESDRILFGVTQMRAASREMAKILKDIRHRRYGSLPIPSDPSVQIERGIGPKAEVRALSAYDMNPLSPCFGYYVARFDVLVARAMKVVFLDVDGVLNCRSRWVKGCGAYWIDPILMSRLVRLCETTGAKIVVSSTWRHGRTVEDLQALLESKGLPSTIRVIGKTPEAAQQIVTGPLAELTTCRGIQIGAWLGDHEEGQVESFVILDDDSDMAHLTDYLVQTGWEDGLLDAHVDRAIALLNRRRA